jgi:toxin HigB-1
VIENFRCKETKKIWERKFSKRFPAGIQKMARRKLVSISISESIDDLRKPPSNQLEKLIGGRKGQYSIRINSQWRICFKWKNGNAADVEIVDYH